MLNYYIQLNKLNLPTNNYIYTKLNSYELVNTNTSNIL